MYSKCTKFIGDNIGKIVTGKEFNFHCDTHNDKKFEKMIPHHHSFYEYYKFSKSKLELYSSQDNNYYKIGHNTSKKIDKDFEGGLVFNTYNYCIKYGNGNNGYYTSGSITADVEIPDDTLIFIKYDETFIAKDIIISNPHYCRIRQV